MTAGTRTGHTGRRHRVACLIQEKHSTIIGSKPRVQENLGEINMIFQM